MRMRMETNVTKNFNTLPVLFSKILFSTKTEYEYFPFRRKLYQILNEEYLLFIIALSMPATSPSTLILTLKIKTLQKEADKVEHLIDIG